MSVEGVYRIRKTLPGPGGGDGFTVENVFTFIPLENGALQGTVDTGGGEPIPFEAGWHKGEFFKIVYAVGPGKWEICGRITGGRVTGVVSILGGGSPDLAEGELL